MSDDNRIQNDWIDQVPDDQWQAYLRVIQIINDRGFGYALGGAFALAAYTGHWRNTKDLDLYVLPQDRDQVIEAVLSTGMKDYYDVEKYDRSWIYRAHQEDIIVDVIWAMANGRSDVDELWFTHGDHVSGRNEILPVIPIEELIWGKIYVLQKERSDWPDILNLIHASGPQVDWDHLVSRMGEDTPLLAALMTLFAWLDPGRAVEFPSTLWERLALPHPEERISEKDIERRAARLDTRPWFYPLF
jgi:hypothetical protein